MPSPLPSWCGICGQRHTLHAGVLFPSAARTGISSIEDPALNVNPALADGAGQLVVPRLEVVEGTAEGQAALRFLVDDAGATYPLGLLSRLGSNR